MNRVVLDQSLRSKLNNLDSQLELCDESGRVVGYFVPAEEHHRLLYDWAQSQFTDEELERARQEPGRTLSEIWARLGQK